jgi:hypothetical protein
MLINPPPYGSVVVQFNGFLCRGEEAINRLIAFPKIGKIASPLHGFEYLL